MARHKIARVFQATAALDEGFGEVADESEGREQHREKERLRGAEAGVQQPGQQQNAHEAGNETADGAFQCLAGAYGRRDPPAP